MNMTDEATQVIGMHHVGVLVADTQRALAFYRDILGLRQLERPPLAYPGAWLDLGQGQQLHLMELPNPDSPERPAHGGRDRHLALQVADLQALQQQLAAADIAYTASASGRAALFCRDADGNTLELLEAESAQHKRET